MSDIRARLQDIFRDVFEDDTLVIRDEMSAKDVPNWDSLQHINMIIAVERGFGVKFAVAEISKLKNPGQNVGTFIQLLESKLKPAA